MNTANKRFKSSREANDYLLTLPDAPREIDRRAVLYKCVKVGENVSIGPYSVIGKDGFGFAGTRRIPHIGGVILEHDVEIGAGCYIDRAKLENTIIGEGTKLDNAVHIAHNCVIGKRNLLCAGVIIGGSAVTGDNCFIGLNATIKDHVRVGDNVTIGAGAVVVKDVPSGQTVASWNPAKAKAGSQ